MKKICRHNSGFSLVELIVVVLIMAIIAVALAPQIMKWVENSRRATDMQLKGNMLSIMQVTVLEPDVISDITDAGGAWMKMDNSGIKLTQGSGSGGSDFGTTSAFYKKFLANSDMRDFSDMKTKAAGTYILLKIDGLAHVVSAQYYDEEGNVIEDMD